VACGSGVDQALAFLLGLERTRWRKPVASRWTGPAASSGSVRDTARCVAIPQMNPCVGASRSTRVMSPCREGSTR
jgi:hypothetical protein